MRKAYIYKITSPSGRIYIGQTVNPKERIRQYKNLYNYKQKLLHNSILKYGWDNHEFEVIDSVLEDKINTLEIHYIALFKSNKYRFKDGNGLNLTDGGEGVKGIDRSYVGERNKIHKYAGEKNGMYGKKRPDLALRNKMRKLSNETRGSNNHKSKAVIDIETGAKYESAFEASKATGINYSTVRYYLTHPDKNRSNLRAA